MAYLGNDLQVAFPVYRNIDDISGSFNSSLKTFPLTVSGVAPVPAPLYSQQCLISVGGVVQRPDDTGSEGFRLSGGNIIFASAPTTGADFFGVILAGADYINAGGNFPSGTAAVPSITFNDDLDTGIYNSGINQVSITTGGSERLRIDSAGQIESVSLGTAAAPAFSFTTDPNTGIYSPGADQVAISTGGSGRLFVDASGRVGVGTSSLSRTFNVAGSAVFDDGTVQTTVWSQFTTGVGGFGTNNNYPIALATNGSERLRITSAGLVGVGTSSPSDYLHISSSGGNTAAVRLQASDGRSYIVGSTGSGYGSANNFIIYDATASAERLRITSAGNVGIGTTSPSALLTVGAAYGGTPNSESRTVIQSAGNSYLTIGAGSSSQAGLLFADTAANNAGGILYTHSSDSLEFLAAGNERLRIDSSGRVGIGTSSPLALLDVRGNVYMTGNGTSRQTTAVVNTGGAFESGVESSAGGAVFTGSTAYASIIGSQNSTPLQFGTNGAVRATLDSSGRVGIGDSAPGTFDVRGAKLTLADSTSDGIGIKGRRDSLDRWYVGYNSSDHLEINQIRNNTLAFKTNNTEVARLTNSGQLLVGTSTSRGNNFNLTGQNMRLQVEGTDYLQSGASFTSNSNTAGEGPHIAINRSRGTTVGSNTVVQDGDRLGLIAFQGNDGAEFVIGASIDCLVDGTPGANDMPGRLVFSVTRDGEASPKTRHMITNGGLQRATSTTHVLEMSTSTSAGTVEYFFDGKYGGTDGSVGTGTRSFVVWTNGNVQNTNNSYTAISDIKLKENIVDAGSQWSDLKTLRVRNYNLKEGQTHRQIGLIAQEVEPISPGLVYESPDRDEDGNDLGTVTKSVNYSVLYMKAVKALQEAMERIEVLEQRLADAGIA